MTQTRSHPCGFTCKNLYKRSNYRLETYNLHLNTLTRSLHTLTVPCRRLLRISIMPLPRDLPLTLTIPTHHQLLLREVREATHDVKQLDPVRRELTIFYWYAHYGRRVNGFNILVQASQRKKTCHAKRAARISQNSRIPGPMLPLSTFCGKRLRGFHRVRNIYPDIRRILWAICCDVC